MMAKSIGGAHLGPVGVRLIGRDIDALDGGAFGADHLELGVDVADLAGRRGRAAARGEHGERESERAKELSHARRVPARRALLHPNQHRLFHVHRQYQDHLPHRFDPRIGCAPCSIVPSMATIVTGPIARPATVIVRPRALAPRRRVRSPAATRIVRRERRARARRRDQRWERRLVLEADGDAVARHRRAGRERRRGERHARVPIPQPGRSASASLSTSASLPPERSSTA